MTDRNREDVKPKLLSGAAHRFPRGRVMARCRTTSQPCPVGDKDLGQGLDDPIVHTVPEVHQAVKRNQPFYGFEDEGRLLSFRCWTNCVQVQFFEGASLDPVPPRAAEHVEVRHLDIRETDELDAGQLRSWIEQASRLPGEKL
jgi:hypothetical protein